MGDHLNGGEGKEFKAPPDYIRTGATVFEFEGKKYDFVVSHKDLYIDGPVDDPKFDSCYIVRPDGIVDGDNGAVSEKDQPAWVQAGVDKAHELGVWPVEVSVEENEEV